ncbi:hypothetical protein [Stutzerimonas stutzeri]|uniref:hypothetical protein n=1 Tax=Stutzerimonas stutzeri TaxID=316 RepID=UPI0014799F75|nr:hypothetical protein [Stutzerimonas stutzeri]WRQ01306.1 hypothetical protein U3Q39_012040 [Stutzerimonas stutzeri]
MFEKSVLMVATGFGLGWVTMGTWHLRLDTRLAASLVVDAFFAGPANRARRHPFGDAVPICHFASLWLGGGNIPSIVADEYLAFPVTVMGSL